MPIALSIAAIVSAALTIAAKLRGSQRGEYVFKPLTTALIVAIAALAEDPISPAYHWLIVAGLVASLVGDVFLMLPGDRFVPGLLAFLVAQICYIVAFTHEASGQAPLWYVIPFVLYGVVMLWWLWPHLEPMRAPVLVYMGVILIMAYQAANRWIETGQDGTLLALAGAYLFVASDSALAVQRFRGAFRYADFWVLSTYFAAQLLIALSVYG